MLLSSRNILKKIELSKRIYAVLVAYQICVTYGIALGYSSYLIPQLIADDHDFQIDDESAYLIGIAGVLLRPAGMVINIFVCEKWGRIFTQKVVFFMLIFSWISISQSPDVTTLIVARLINGLIIGSSMCGVVYISEITSVQEDGEKMAAVYLSFFPATVTFGNGLSSLIMYFFDWRITGCVLAGYSAATFACLCTLPESPVWYVARGRPNDAVRSLKWFTVADNYRTNDFTTRRNTITSVDATETGRTTLFIVFVLAIASQCVGGYFVVSNYSVEFFANVQTIVQDAQTLSIVYGVVCFVSSLTLCWLVFQYDLRNLLVYSSVVMIISALSTALCQTAILLSDSSNNNSLLSHVLQITLLVSFFVYTVFQYSANGEVLWIMAVRIFPTAHYGLLEIIDTILETVAQSFLPTVIYGRYFLQMFICFVGSSALLLHLTSSRLPKLR